MIAVESSLLMIHPNKTEKPSAMRTENTIMTTIIVSKPDSKPPGAPEATFGIDEKKSSAIQCSLCFALRGMKLVPPLIF